MSKSGYSRSGLFGTINHYDSHGHDTASYARVYQTRAGFQTPTRVFNYLHTDGQLIVQGRTACSIPSLTASLAAVSRPSMNNDINKNIVYNFYIFAYFMRRYFSISIEFSRKKRHVLEFFGILDM